MCQGFAAILGEPRRVSALGAARRGARTAPSAKPRSAATSPSAVDSSAKAIPIWRGREADRFQQLDLAVLLAGPGADEDSDDDEGDDQKQDREQGDDHLRALSVAEREVALVLPSLQRKIPRTRGRRKGCRRARSEYRSRGGIRKPHRLRPAPTVAIGLDLLERRPRDPGETGVAAWIPRLAWDDRRPEDGSLERPVLGLHLQAGTDLDPERMGEAALEHDAAFLQRRAAGHHGSVDRRAASQAGELNAFGTTGRFNGRQRERDRRAALGHTWKRADGDRIGL
jgi:hypothetical protein